MKTCNVVPTMSTCKSCLVTQESYSMVEDCDRCTTSKTYELLGFSGDYAIVQYEGVVSKVYIEQLKNVTEKI